MRFTKTIFIFLLLLSGCERTDLRPKVNGVEYFPMKVGGYWTYDVLSTSITQLGGQTTLGYEMKIQVTDSVISSGEISYMLQRFKRDTPSQAWVSIGTWSARKDEFQAIIQEGNTPYVKLEFPLLEGKTWNGNLFNTLGGNDQCPDGTFNCDNYVVKDLNKQFEGSGVSFENSVTILENNDNDPIVMQDVRKSVYAKSVGLVYKEIAILEYCTVGPCIGQQIVENGSILKQTIKDYGGL